jgi:hypothetical protein
MYSLQLSVRFGQLLKEANEVKRWTACGWFRDLKSMRHHHEAAAHLLHTAMPWPSASSSTCSISECNREHRMHRSHLTRSTPYLTLSSSVTLSAMRVEMDVGLRGVWSCVVRKIGVNLERPGD